MLASPVAVRDLGTYVFGLSLLACGTTVNKQVDVLPKAWPSKEFLHSFCSGWNAIVTPEWRTVEGLNDLLLNCCIIAHPNSVVVANDSIYQSTLPINRTGRC
jgi:hypothetical protein